MLCSTLACSTSIDISETERGPADSLVIGRVMRFEGWKADQNEQKEWMTFKVIMARQCLSIGTNEGYGFKVDDQTGFFAFKVPGPDSGLKPVTSLALSCAFSHGQNNQFYNIPIIENVSISHEPGKVYVIHARKFRFGDWSGIKPIETKVDETGELNAAIIGEFREKYPAYNDLTNFSFIK